MTARDPIHVVFAGGGTGGHLFPGLAVAARLREALPAVRVTFVGSGRALERTHVAAAGYEYVALRCRPLPRRPWHLPGFVADNLAGYLTARRLLREENVGVVVGLGGFASVPMARAAIARRVPLVLLEQNAVPGRATRWLARRARVVCLAMAQSQGHFPRACNLQVTGNPIRVSVIHSAVGGDCIADPLPRRPGRRYNRLLQSRIPRHAQPETGNECLELDGPRPQRRLLILGGSGGAGSLNENVPRALGRLGRRLAGWSVLHQSGSPGFDATRRRYQALGVPATVVPFIDDVGSALATSGLAVCRAGGTTLAELAAAGVPAVLVPYPRAAADHQCRNAGAYATGGGCLVVEEQGPAGPLDARLAETLAAILPDARLRRAMSRAMRRLARPDAAGEVADVLQRLVA